MPLNSTDVQYSHPPPQKQLSQILHSPWGAKGDSRWTNCFHHHPEKHQKHFGQNPQHADFFFFFFYKLWGLMIQWQEKSSHLALCCSTCISSDQLVIGFHFHRESSSLFISVLFLTVLAVAALNYGTIVFVWFVPNTSHTLKYDQLREFTVCSEEVGRKLCTTQQTQSNIRLHLKLCVSVHLKKRIFSC